MRASIDDPGEVRRLIRRRRRLGLDRSDEVWDGVYVMSPLADDDHQSLVMGLSFAFQAVIHHAGLGQVRPGVGVSDRRAGWTRNYRCPDVAVFLEGTAAVNLGTHWLGGPDLAVEILSKGDRARKKLRFYASVRTGELLLVDRSPWALELYRLDGGAMVPAGHVAMGDPGPIDSTVLPLRFRLEPTAVGRPRIVIEHAEGPRTWSA